MLYSDDDFYDSGFGFLGSQLEDFLRAFVCFDRFFCRCANNILTLMFLLEGHVLGLIHFLKCLHMILPTL